MYIIRIYNISIGQKQKRVTNVTFYLLIFYKNTWLGDEVKCASFTTYRETALLQLRTDE